MTDLFGHDDLIATARRNPAVGPPSSFTESLASAYNTTMMVGRSDSANMALFDAWASYLTEVRDRTGASLPNPYGATPELRLKPTFPR